MSAPAASDHLLCQASRADTLHIHKHESVSARSPFAHLAHRRRDAAIRLRRTAIQLGGLHRFSRRAKKDGLAPLEMLPLK